MNKEFLELEKVKNRAVFFKDVEAYKPLTLIKKVVGYSLVGLGVVSLPLPTGSIFLIIGGCALVGIDYKKLLGSIKFYSGKVGVWLYQNRNKKLRSYNRHLRGLLE